MQSFRSAEHTAIISDLHLCEAEVPHPRYPLWKKYKTKEFFFDSEFSLFLEHIKERSGGRPVELILNGDVFDFDSVTALPADPPYKITWLERERGLHPEESKSLFKIRRILDDHPVFVKALAEFLALGHRVVFIIGNHDLELHWPDVQSELVRRLAAGDAEKERIRFCEWFYISNEDTLVEHGNQYDPYCVCLDPINPYLRRYNRVEMRLPFGNIACRYLGNGMGFFNPHVEDQFTMSMGEYFRFFLKYIVRAQPLVVWTWFWGSSLTLVQSVRDSLRPTLRHPLKMEDQIERVALKANATPRMVRELRELRCNPATQEPEIVARELWMDRAFFVLAGLLVLLQIFITVKQVYDISVFWLFVPILAYVPFFLFYAQAIRSNIPSYREPQERILAMASAITKTQRIVYGHTHIVRHEVIGAVEHLNSGTWSPGFADIECTQPVGYKSFVWIQPGADGLREAQVLKLDFQGTTTVTQAFLRDPVRRPRHRVRLTAT